ncbi:MAG: hypothetical protein Q9214_001176 [Letrouitia sp. 1 TL-2023]
MPCFLRPSPSLQLLKPPLHARQRNSTRPRKNPPRTNRRFGSSPLSPIQTLTASRILPYPSHQLYNLIADIAAYPSFLPFCTSSTITSVSSPDPAYSKTWPRTASLRIGWGPYDETFSSAVYCLPYTVLEACAGNAIPSIPASDLPHYPDSSRPLRQSDGNHALFTSLLTRWTFREFPFKPRPPDGPPQEGTAEKVASQPRTEVSLVIEVGFANAVYSALSQAAAPKVAGLMVEAFERRAGQVLGKGHVVDNAEENRSAASSLR